jgi:hypothetical protein
MALTPEGTPYVESTDLVANYPAASLSLANRVDLVGVLPFADSAARATAIPSPTDGQYSYLQDTNSTEFWNGSAWVSASAAPGLVHINTDTFTAQSSVSLDNVFTSTYENYTILLRILATGANVALNMRLRAGGSDNSTASSYIEQLLQVNNTSVAGGRITSNLWQIGSISSTTQSALRIDIFGPQLAEPTVVMAHQMNPSSSAILEQHYGTHNQSTAYDGFTVSLSNAITGSIRVYGYSNS